jgi:5-methylcytosine-specific restriction endonuclease McrBC regulatory subunit McrC
MIRIASQSISSLGYWELILRLDDLFEAYVGKTWGYALSNKFERKSLAPYYFQIGDSNLMTLIRPDHVFRDAHLGRLIVVDAKYRTDIGSSEQIYQLLAYLDYNYPEECGFTDRIGILVYPSLTWKCEPIKGFRHQVYCVQMPVTASFEHQSIAEMVDRAFA